MGMKIRYPTRKDGRLVFPKLYWFIQQLLASIANKRWISHQEFEEICRGN